MDEGVGRGGGVGGLRPRDSETLTLSYCCCRGILCGRAARWAAIAALILQELCSSVHHHGQADHGDQGLPAHGSPQGRPERQD